MACDSSFNIVPGATSNSGVDSTPKARASKLNTTPLLSLTQLLPGTGPSVSTYEGPAFWVGTAQRRPLLTLSMRPPESTTATLSCPSPA